MIVPAQPEAMTGCIQLLTGDSGIRLGAQLMRHTSLEGMAVKEPASLPPLLPWTGQAVLQLLPAP